MQDIFALPIEELQDLFVAAGLKSSVPSRYFNGCTKSRSLILPLCTT